MQRVQQGDTVEVIAGRDKGLRGEVVRVLVKKNRVIVNGVNILKRHQKARPGPGGQQIPAQIMEFEAPLHLSNVMLVCPHTDERTRVGYRINSDGLKVRYSKRSGRDID
ncbi:MAG: 50S ribosomal protein L24 [Chloroflexi bacterium]|nr:50S ribosomal protein L24 [Chloroflexota bacterium]MCY3581062.1 50S ribosomal protein L24 [Chloroflexota bacterium]MCY3715251.1 50S ribosomal protein L24 [Chloroflexota bacterium]MDE2650022.1 50S ribosomal protein L24 [Chloroflexota bacterium]MXV93752.1 50S ribosomal protein L24 [Chloroflexota bacterium]